jgi:hypothetical protein
MIYRSGYPRCSRILGLSSAQFALPETRISQIRLVLFASIPTSQNREHLGLKNEESKRYEGE